MNKYYIAKKWLKSSDFQNHRIALYRYDPPTKSCYPEGKRAMTTGQLLCYLGCPELEKWHLIGQMTICDFSITCYGYSSPADSKDIVKVIVTEYCPPYNCQSVDGAEPHTNTPKVETGGLNMKEHQFIYHLTPAEFQLIFNLLGDEKIKLEQLLQSNDLNKQTRKNKASQYETIQNLETRIRKDMDNWLLHYPIHAYSQWRMEQLRRYSDKIIKLFDLEQTEE